MMNEQRKTIRDEETKKQLMTRLNRIKGQIGGVSRMVEEDRYCDDILIQLSSIDKAIKSIANMMLKKHMHGCLVEQIKEGNYEGIDEIISLFRRFQ